MFAKRVLYISGSLGLGHIHRDLAIANELRRQNPDVEIDWLAAHPASVVLQEAGERLLPEAEQYADDNVPAEQAARGFRLNLIKYLSTAMGEWKQNVETFAKVIGKNRYDLIIGDETYEISLAITNDQVKVDAGFVMMYDFIGNDAMSWSPLERLGVYMWNRAWAKLPEGFTHERRIALFIGEPEDVPNTGLGPFLPKRRKVASICKFTGYVLPFDPADYADKAAVRRGLGYGDEPLIICTIGGTRVGKPLLELCGRAYPLVKRHVPNVHMVLICGPRLSPEELDVPDGVDVRGYVPRLYEHLAACDLAITQCGGTTTLELTALRRPFLYFPIEEHFEQQVHVAGRLARHRAGVRMAFSRTTPELLAEAIIEHLGKEATWPPIRTDGARRAAQLISQLL